MSPAPFGWRCTWVWSAARLASSIKPTFAVFPTEAEAQAKAAALRALAAQQGAVVAISVAPDQGKRRRQSA